MGLFNRIFGRRPTPPRNTKDLGRNQPCWCGSGHKYKQCHLDRDERRQAEVRAAACTSGG